MNLLLSMTLAGSLVLFIYLISLPASVRFFSSFWRYRLLKLALLFYLLPYQYLKPLYCSTLKQIPALNIFFPSKEGYEPYDLDRIILIDSNGIQFMHQNLFLGILTIWGIAVVIFVLYHFVKYAACCRNLIKITAPPSDTCLMIWKQCGQKLSHRTNVSLFSSPYIETPFTIGVFSPKIILPASLTEETSLRMILSHELCHIKNHDILIKSISLFNILLHWYNPLSYLLYWELCRVCEYVCDETVIQSMNPEEKKSYELLLIGLNSSISNRTGIYQNFLSSNFKTIKRRITLMEKRTPSLKLTHIASLLTAALLLLLCPLPVVAYSPMITFTFAESAFNIENAGELYSGLDPAAVERFAPYDPLLELNTSQDVWIDNDHVPHIVKTSEAQRAICIHSWTNSSLYQHAVNNDGDCCIYSYSCQLCSKCNTYKNLELVNTLTYVKCPHK